MEILLQLFRDWVLQCPEDCLRRTAIYLNCNGVDLKMEQEPKAGLPECTISPWTFHYSMTWHGITMEELIGRDHPGYLKFIIQKAAFEIDRKHKEWKGQSNEGGQTRTTEAASCSESRPDERQGPSAG